MSFGMPAVKPNPGEYASDDLKVGAYGVPDIMTHGISMCQPRSIASHPLELSEKLYMKNRERLNMTILRNTQGLHAPLKLSMELRAAEKIGRLPFLPSSGLMKDVLTGRDEEIGFEDIFNTPEFSENMCQPHAMVEKHLGIL